MDDGTGMKIKQKIKTGEGPRLKYPWEQFWEYAVQFNPEVIVNSDAHRPEHVVASRA